jgi:hypothetical protein
LVRGLYNIEEKIYFIGIYDGSKFPGTDKLSMAVQPHFIKLIKSLSNSSIFVFEGDRLFNQSLFDKVESEIIVIKANKNILDLRHDLRNDTQTDKFKKSKKTKIKNIIDRNEITIFDNNNKEESSIIKKHILELIKKAKNNGK